jgi:hypothetical protein
MSQQSLPHVIPNRSLPESSPVLQRADRRAIARRLDLPLGLLIAGLNIVYFVNFLFPYSIIIGDAPDTYRYRLFGFGLMVIGGLLRIWQREAAILKLPKYRAWFAAYMAVIAIMCVRSLLAGVTPIRILGDAMTYLLFFVAFLGQGDRDWKLLRWTFVLHGLVGVLYTGWALSRISVTWRLEFVLSPLYPAYQYLYAWPILILSYPMLPRLGKLVALLSPVAILTIAIFGQYRGLFTYELIGYLLLAVFAWRRSGTIEVPAKRILFVWVSLIATVLFLGLATPWGESSGFQASFEQLLRRQTQYGSPIETFASDYRWYEANLLIHDLSPDEWVIGRGISASWQFWDAYGGEIRNMAHLGYLHLIFKGGLVFLLLWLIFPLAQGWKALLGSRDLVTLAAAGFTAFYTFELITGGILNASPYAVVLYLSAGQCAAYDLIFAQTEAISIP